MYGIYPGYLNEPGEAVGQGYFYGVTMNNPLFEIKKYINRCVSLDNRERISDLFTKMSQSIGLDFYKNVFNFILDVTKKSSDFNFGKYRKLYKSQGDAALIEFIDEIMYNPEYSAITDSYLSVYIMESDKYYKFIDKMISLIKKIVNSKKSEVNIDDMNYKFSDSSDVKKSPSSFCDENTFLNFLEEKGKILVDKTVSELYSKTTIREFLVDDIKNKKNLFKSLTKLIVKL